MEPTALAPSSPERPQQRRSDGVALAHHWLVGMRGGEKVLEEFSSLFPSAPIYTLVTRQERLSAAINKHRLVGSLLDRLPMPWRYYKQTLPLFPLLIGNLRVRGKPPLLLSSDASLIKGLRVPDGVPHVCYCHSPPRYLWDQQEAYGQAAGIGTAARWLLRAITPLLRNWDYRAAQRVDYFIANSAFVRERIKTAYGKESVVIHPPVAVDDFRCEGEPEDFYLIVSQVVPYKRIDLAVAAFNQLGKRLVIIGEGSELASLRQNAGSNITFLGAQPFAVLRDHYTRCRAFIFPGIEDFGITPLEAQASGRPVIALRAGGVLETVIEGSTGLFFDKQDPESLAAAVLAFEQREWDPTACRNNALRFGAERFRREIQAFLAARGLPASDTFSAEAKTIDRMASRVRVAVVSEPGKAGVKTHVMDILQNIDVSRFEVAYFYSLKRSDQDYPGEIQGLLDRGIACHEIAMDVRIRPWEDFRALLSLRRHLTKFVPAILHLHSSKAGGIGRLLAPTLSHRPYVIYTPNAMACYWSKKYLWLERFLGLFSDLLIAASVSEKSDFVRWKIPHARKAVALTVGVRSDFVANPTLSTRPWTIGACGRICYQKNAVLFFSAALKMAALHPNIRFRWIGDFADDAEARQVRELLSAAGPNEQIEVTGWVSQPQQQVAELDTFCMFSRYESFGYVTADAMLLGVPVLATLSTGTVDLVEDGETGLLTNSTIPEVLEGWTRIKDDIALRNHLRTNAKARILTRHTNHQMSAELDAIYWQHGRGFLPACATS